MTKTLAGLVSAVVLLGSSAALAQAEPDGFQNDDMPGSEIQIDIGKGGTTVQRADGKPLFGNGKPASGGEMPMTEEASEEEPDPLDGEEEPVGPNAIDEELPGEGPESLSGPDDDDPLPF